MAAKARKDRPVPKNVPCPCGRGKLALVMDRTTHNGRTCTHCNRSVLCCRWCQTIFADWECGPPNSELDRVPLACPGCGSILNMDGPKRRNQ